MPEIYKGPINFAIKRVDSERGHVMTRELLHLSETNPLTLKILEQFSYGRKRFSDPRLNVVVGGVTFDNPVLVGAGWDKAGRAVRALHRLGFAGVEVGSVLENPQAGNDKPRQFVKERGVALNRLGFNSPGMEVVKENLKRYWSDEIPIGISIGNNKEVPAENAPIAHGFVAYYLYDQADYFVINVSSPNTPGLRELQDKGPLTDIVRAVNHAMDVRGTRKPLFVKIAPDLTNEAVDDVIEVVIDNELTGIIATNTTTSPEIKAKHGWGSEAGGLSGDDPDFRRMATEKVRHIYKEAGDRLTIIGIGGIKDAPTALDKISAGARMIQVVTGIRGEGPTVAGRITRGLVDFMEREGIKNIGDLVGQPL